MISIKFRLVYVNLVYDFHSIRIWLSNVNFSECKTEGKLLLQSSSRQKSRDRVSRVDSTRSHSHSKPQTCLVELKTFLLSLYGVYIETINLKSIATKQKAASTALGEASLMTKSSRKCSFRKCKAQINCYFRFLRSSSRKLATVALLKLALILIDFECLAAVFIAACVTTTKTTTTPTTPMTMTTTNSDEGVLHD